MSSDSLMLALWQGAGTSGNVQDNLGEIERCASQAAEVGAELLIFPECFLTGYVTPSPHEIADGISETHYQELTRVSQQTGLCLVVGSYGRCNGKLANAALVFDPEKGLIGTYRKHMLYGPWEKGLFQRGAMPLTFTFRGWRVGVLICFDVEFPAMVRNLARQRCDLVVVPTALMKPYDNVARHLIATRALENQLFVAYANRTGAEGSNRYLGMSLIAGPDGSVILQAPDDTEQLLHSELTRGALEEARKDFSYLDEDCL